LIDERYRIQGIYKGADNTKLLLREAGP
jgi:hypothetical protein